MRSPSEVPYMFALEIAIDEIAAKLKMDPIELRRINDTQREPIKGNPYTSRSLMKWGANSTASKCSAVITVCDRIRAKLFKATGPKESLTRQGQGDGWIRRNCQPGHRKERQASGP
jgi:hypothetical protein